MTSSEHQDETARMESTDWWNGLTDKEKAEALAITGKTISFIEQELGLKIDFAINKLTDDATAGGGNYEQ